MEQKIFFQSSMPRALSTIFQNIVGQNPDFHVTPTDGLLELLFGARANFTNCLEFKAQNSTLMKQAFLSFCYEGVKGYNKILTDKPYILNKSRGWGVYRGFLDSFYPNPKIICMVRDLKDIVASYENMYRKSLYLHDSIRNDLDSRGTTVHKRVDEWMNPKNTIGRATERIFEIVRLGYANQILFIKSEDLCRNPKKEMERFYNYLDLPFYEHDFLNIEQLTTEDDTVYGISQDLHKIRPELKLPESKAKSILGDDITRWLYENNKWYYEMFGYRQ